ncbi:hypothetical protein F441_08660 [Phytophthora nicotianae CJ01A1]|uniref:Uncharacterized protein n=4 Tax=Phytophthora nicotianae TaxID=4792 RepID=V9F7E6_PHYNI|nr:hypothetical protein F443_08690 [Phytophthora nicotianae P1569]ETK86929.1 hypothetical protein L915_08519 [Phytophthora nicotianae]ETL40343.1 hypothetical protein L916_08449 [Phytophthora nicotianae]ETO75714.1 hypothetical protein F444_08741 [Phytophthora nicotianae P1976]ETP16800.1 hypothetical protein F441_08660 [Phytophthora nicotianae CJ01A1]
MNVRLKRCTPRVYSIALLLSLGLIAVYLDSKLAWSTLPSPKHVFRSFGQAAHNEPHHVDSIKLQLAQTLNNIAQNTSQPRGIVIPVYEPIVKLAASLILELRTMGVDAPVEMPYCGDVSIESQTLFMQKSALGSIRYYDVCELAAAATIEGNSTKKLFCDNIEACYTKFRSFDIKVISVVFSNFEEIMMIDADTGFFVSPAVLWGSEKYKATGTLLMNDRTAHEIYFMAERVGGSGNISFQHRYMSKFDPAPFRSIPTLEREKATLPNPVPVKLKFGPSDYLLTSHSWNLRTGHQVDSSILFWNKKKQPRATAILGSFKALGDIGSPPSYGDKELYFYAAELAETQYSFSDHAIGAVGTDYRDHGEKNSTLCGDMAQVFPIKQASEDDVPLFYLNSDRVLHFKPEVEPVYYMKARMADVYLGAFGERRMECPFQMTGARFSDAEARHLTGRQRLHELVIMWENIAQDNTNDPQTKETRNVAADGMVDEKMHEMREAYRQVIIPNV